MNKEEKELLEKLETTLLMQVYNFKVFSIMFYKLYKALREFVSKDIDLDEYDEDDEIDDEGLSLKDFVEVEKSLPDLKDNSEWERAIV